MINNDIENTLMSTIYIIIISSFGSNLLILGKEESMELLITGVKPTVRVCVSRGSPRDESCCVHLACGRSVRLLMLARHSVVPPTDGPS